MIEFSPYCSVGRAPIRNRVNCANAVHANSVTNDDRHSACTCLYANLGCVCGIQTMHGTHIRTLRKTSEHTTGILDVVAHAFTHTHTRIEMCLVLAFASCGVLKRDKEKGFRIVMFATSVRVLFNRTHIKVFAAIFCARVLWTWHGIVLILFERSSRVQRVSGFVVLCVWRWNSDGRMGGRDMQGGGRLRWLNPMSVWIPNPLVEKSIGIRIDDATQKCP